jgi:hypothetical protein
MVITHSHYITSLSLNLIGLYAGSDIIHMSVLGQSVIIINKYETAVEILDKRSGIYSSRSVSITLYSFPLRESWLTCRVDLPLQCLISYLGGVMV